MAYTLNNYQPVLCTLLNDQPYFYMDEDIGDDAEEGLFETDALESEVAGLQRKIEAYERLSEHFGQPTDQRFQDFLSDARFICEHTVPAVAADAAETLIARLNESRFASTLLSFAQTHGVELICTPQVLTACYDRDGGKILVNPDVGAAGQILLAARELRRHWQHRHGVLLHPLTFHPDQAILINRAQKADLAAAMVRVGWELQLAGDKDVWTEIEHSPMADLGRAFAREAFMDFRTMNNGLANAAVFESWFLSDRCRHQDKKLIQAMLADYQGYVFGSEQVSRTISIDLISALGEMPFGKNYLAGYAEMIMSDPIFTEVRDRSNANFLWFIKFERSFRETEQQLQPSGVIHNPADQDGNNQKTLEDRRNEDLSAVVAIADVSGSARRNSGPLESGSAQSNVIYVPFGQFAGFSGEAVQ